ncbi:MAG: 5-methylcytosine-specific restriction enzyme subunit McrC [Candidatus Azotimanducaceae bacterium]|jgi:5-methylcytosine-specific restriction enzyme subunit McrC
MDFDGTAAASQVANGESIQLIGKIPVRNLWLLMLYASELYRQIGTAKIAVEDNPEEIADLVAEVLCHEVERRLKRNLSYGYQPKIATIGRVRGRIDILYTERHRLLDKGKVRCHFEELTTDTPRNRFIRAALENLQVLVTNKNLSRRCRALALSLYRLGVSKGKSASYSSKNERLGRHDSKDQKMVAAADLAFSLSLPTQFSGQHTLPTPAKDDHWLRKLFEKGIAGFYSVALDNSKWRVQANRQFNWQVTDETAGIKMILPSMEADIIVSEKCSGERLVIDTKFNSVTTEGYYRKETLRSGYLYQMYAYLRSQEDRNDSNTLNVRGMLLHPTTHNEVNESVTIQGHPIRFCTVNLGNVAPKIREQLLQLVFDSFGDLSKGLH